MEKAKASKQKPSQQPPAAAKHKRCFIVSPIGAPQTEIREHADDVFDFIIKPATERAGYVSHRGDHNAAPGKITDQMFHSILNDELIIAVLTYQNPNVYFELAVAQSAARPVVLMIQQGETLPFDVRDQRVIYYDLKPRPLFGGTYSDKLYEAIRQIEAQQERCVPFAPDQAPLGASGGQLTLLARQADHKTEDYIAFLRSSERFVLLSGISLQSWHKRSHYGDALRRQIDKGCRVKVMFMDAENPALEQMLNDTTPTKMVRDEINHSLSRWSDMMAASDAVEVRTVKRGIVMSQSTLNENGVAHTPYQFSVSTTDSPTFIARPGSPLYHTQKLEFERLWAANPLAAS